MLPVPSPMILRSPTTQVTTHQHQRQNRESSPKRRARRTRQPADRATSNHARNQATHQRLNTGACISALHPRRERPPAGGPEDILRDRALTWTQGPSAQQIREPWHKPSLSSDLHPYFRVSLLLVPQCERPTALLSILTSNTTQGATAH